MLAYFIAATPHHCQCRIPNLIALSQQMTAACFYKLHRIEMEPWADPHTTIGQMEVRHVPLNVMLLQLGLGVCTEAQQHSESARLTKKSSVKAGDLWVDAN